jgi:hypothetical protein
MRKIGYVFGVGTLTLGMALGQAFVGLPTAQAATDHCSSLTVKPTGTVGSPRLKAGTGNVGWYFLSSVCVTPAQQLGINSVEVALAIRPAPGFGLNIPCASRTTYNVGNHYQTANGGVIATNISDQTCISLWGASQINNLTASGNFFY